MKRARPNLFGLCWSLGLSWLLVCVPFVAGQQSTDQLQVYTSRQGLWGRLSVAGSDTLLSAMQRWEEGFEAIYPYVDIEVDVTGRDSARAASALVERQAELGHMSRRMTLEEQTQFRQTFGYAPVVIRVAMNAVGVFVHPENPIRGLSIAQLAAIFSRPAGQAEQDGQDKQDEPAAETIQTWGDLGLKGPWASRKIQLFGRGEGSGTAQFFKKSVFTGGMYSPAATIVEKSQDVVQAIISNLDAIGYAPIGEKTEHVRIVPIGHTAGSYFEPTPEHCLSVTYPLVRFLYFYINKDPQTELNPLLQEFVGYILSREGQIVLAQSGHLPLPFDMGQGLFQRMVEDMERVETQVTGTEQSGQE